jgi:iron complex transport system ATP-binding protein
LIIFLSFETFFDKKGITFDSSTGKLTANKPSCPIAVEGDVNTAYWVGNALIRNGFRPSSAKESRVRIHCSRPDKIVLSLPGMPELSAGCVAELIAAVMMHKCEILRENDIG